MPKGKAVAVVLTPDEREVLERNVRRRKSSYALAMRSRMVLLAADGLTNEAIAERVGAGGVEAVIVATLESKPEGATHWSTRSMAKKMGLTQSAVSRIWRAFGLQ